MKKPFLTLIALFATLQFSYAQWTNGTNISNTNTGNVGIGTTSPTEKLDVSGNLKLNGNITFANDQTAYLIHPQGNGGAIRLRTNESAATDRNVQFGNIDNLGNWGSFMTVAENGNVGIGTTSPRSLLEVNGAISITGETGLPSTGVGVELSYQTSGNNGRIIAYDRTSSVYKPFIINDNMYVGGYNGNLGIGTTDTHGYKLAVNGAIHSKSVKVDLIGWPDFVFLKDYKFPTLTEVKTYIDKNQRLPDMPSAGEVHANGLDLGEMNRLLLKKVEELTLYLME